MAKLTVTIVASNKAIVADETGKTWEVPMSFHARRLNGEYKYHEIYVYLNKLEDFKAEYKAPKTLGQKWKYNPETKKFKSLGTPGVKILGYVEAIDKSSRAMFDLDSLEYDEE